MGRAPNKALPSQEELKQIFVYDPETGVLTWREDRGRRAKAGHVCGHVSSDGYRHVTLWPRSYLAHRLIWKLVNDQEPECVDHIDLDKQNNRLSNLRAATASQNKSNGRIYRNNRSGYKGVCWEPSHRSWKAYISVHGRQIKLGRFKHIEEAHMAVTAARVRLHGEFARSA
jgi:hypothetical protein